MAGKGMGEEEGSKEEAVVVMEWGWGGRRRGGEVGSGRDRVSCLTLEC